MRLALRALRSAAAIALALLPSLATAQPSQFTPAGMGGGGALFSPSFSPHNPNELYLSCDMSELFHSTDLGASWEVKDFRQIQGGNVTGMVQFTGSPSILYTIDNRNDAPRPVRSIDGGSTWHPINDPTGGEAYHLYADIRDANRVILTDFSHLYFSNDGGATFALKFTGSPAAGLHVGGAFFDGNTIYVGTNSGLLVSTNNGGSFAPSPVGGIPEGEAIVSFAGARQNGTVRFFCVTLGSSDVYAGITGAEHWNYRSLYSLTVGEANWRQSDNGILIGDHPFFVAMAQNNVDVAYVAGGGFNNAPIVYKTVNGGNHWSSVLQTDNNANVVPGWSGAGGDRGWSYGEYALGFTVSPTDAGRAAITDLGFVHLTTDGGNGWRQAYLAPADQNIQGFHIPKGRAYHSNGLENTTCWRVAWADSSTMIGCYSDIRGTISTDAGVTWSQNYAGHTDNTMYYALYGRTQNTLYAATSSVHDIYQSTTLTDARLDEGRGKVLFSTNRGGNWQVLHDFAHPVIWLALDPNHPNRMYASVIHSSEGGIYVSDDINLGGASTWRKLADPARAQGHPFNIHVLKDGTLLASYSGRRELNVFTNSSGVFISTDNGASWIDRSSTKMLYWTKDVVVDPHDPTEKTWYAGVFSGWGGAPNGLGGLYKTTDRGVNWTKILSVDRVTSCTISPTDSNEMYVTTEVDGLWYTGNLRSPSPTFSPVTGYPFRQPERVFYNPYKPDEVWVTSFGNGMRRGISAPKGTPPPAPLLRYPADDSTSVPVSWQLVWNGAQGASSYRVQISTSESFSGTVLDQGGVGSTMIPFSGLAGETTYYWRVAASNAAGTGGWSQTWSFTTAKADQPVPPAAPPLLSPANDSTGVPVTGELVWSAAAGAERYRVQISTSPAFSSMVVDQSGVSDLRQPFSGLARSTRYYWRVGGANAVGNGPWSQTWSFTTVGDDQPLPPAAPPLISPADDSIGVPLSGSLVWSAVTGAAAYRAQLSTDPGFTTTVIDQQGIAGSSTSLPFTGLAPATRYYWRVRAGNAAGESPWSVIWDFMTVGVSGVEALPIELPTKLDLK